MFVFCFSQKCQTTQRVPLAGLLSVPFLEAAHTALFRELLLPLHCQDKTCVAVQTRKQYISQKVIRLFWMVGTSSHRDISTYHVHISPPVEHSWQYRSAHRSDTEHSRFRLYLRPLHLLCRLHPLVLPLHFPSEYSILHYPTAFEPDVRCRRPMFPQLPFFRNGCKWHIQRQQYPALPLSFSSFSGETVSWGLSM